MSKYKTRVITDESQVPEGWKRYHEITESPTQQKRLSDAQTEGLIEAVKLMRSPDDRTGPVWVRPDQAASILSPPQEFACGNLTKAPWSLEECPAIVRLTNEVAEILKFQATFQMQIDDVLVNVQRLNREFGVSTKATKEE